MEKGEDIEVTEENKMQYLDRLAQYRLAKCVKDEIEHFLKGDHERTYSNLQLLQSCISGLNEIVPDNLLTMFDENELEVIETLPYFNFKLRICTCSF